MIEATDLRKSYGDRAAVRGVTLRIERGVTFGLLGPNGAGKTTTIHMLVGVLHPDSGTVRIDGRGAPTDAGVRRQIGIAPQKLSLYDELSAAENLAFFGRLYGLAGADLDRAVYSALALAGLADRRRDRVSTFSGGMQRRLNLACATLSDPPVLLLDEPTVGVDPQLRNHLFEQVQRLKSAGRTIVYTTHLMEEAERLCDRVAIIDQGVVLAEDTVDGLIATHGGHSTVIAELDADPPPDVTLPAKPDGRTLRFESADPLEALIELRQRGIRCRDVRIERPDLESVFLKLTGRRLRDE